MCNHLYILLTTRNFKFYPTDPTACCYSNEAVLNERKKLILNALDDIRIILKLRDGQP